MSDETAALSHEERGQSSGWGWRVPARERELPLVRVPVRGQGAFWVDLFSLREVRAFDAPTLDALGALAAVFGDDWLRRTLGRMGPGGYVADGSVAPGPLSDAWSRLATVFAVRQWTPYAVDRRVLALDEALAWDEVGDGAWARAGAALESLTVGRLVAALQVGDLPSGAAGEVHRLAALSVRALPEADPVRRALLATEEADRTGAGATGPDGHGLTWLPSDLVAPGYPVGGVAPGSGLDVLVDLARLPAGLVRVAADGEPAVTVRVVGEDSVSVRIELGAVFESADDEIRDLVLFAADPRDGRVVGEGAVAPDGLHRVTGTVRWPSGVDAPVVGVCGREELDRARDGGMRQDAAAETRLVLAWATARLAAAQAGPFLDRAHAAGDRAAQLVAGTSRAGDGLRAALDAVASQVAGLSVTVTDDAPRGPLLAERLFGLDVGDLPELEEPSADTDDDRDEWPDGVWSRDVLPKGVGDLDAVDDIVAVWRAALTDELGLSLGLEMQPVYRGDQGREQVVLEQDLEDAAVVGALLGRELVAGQRTPHVTVRQVGASLVAELALPGLLATRVRRVTVVVVDAEGAATRIALDLRARAEDPVLSGGIEAPAVDLARSVRLDVEVVSRAS